MVVFGTIEIQKEVMTPRVGFCVPLGFCRAVTDADRSETGTCKNLADMLRDDSVFSGIHTKILT